MGSPTEWHRTAHSHNDYRHARPLELALEHHFASVEADIWLVDGQVIVGHDEGENYGSLARLYLDPLQRRVERSGSVHGDGEPFLLWVDIKDGQDELRARLHDTLSRYPMLSTFDQEGDQPGAVTVILTGNGASKDAYRAEYDTRYAIAAQGGFSPDHRTNDIYYRWNTLKWSEFFGWYGLGEMPQYQVERLRELVQEIHARGRRVRLYATPDLPTYWRVALETGVDLINTDRVADLNAFLSSY